MLNTVKKSQEKEVAPGMHLHQLKQFVFSSPYEDFKVSRHRAGSWKLQVPWWVSGPERDVAEGEEASQSRLCLLAGHTEGKHRKEMKEAPLAQSYLSVCQSETMWTHSCPPPRSRPRGVISTPIIRTFVRGGRCHARAFRSHGAYLVSL